MKEGWVSSDGWGCGGYGPRAGWWCRAALKSLSPLRLSGTVRNGRLAPAARIQREPASGQTKSGACRSEGLVAGEHVPDRFGQLAAEVDLGDLWAALAAESLLGALVAVAVGRVVAGMQRRFEERPAQVARALL